VNDEFACVAHFEFGDGDYEQQELFVGTEEECDNFHAGIQARRENGWGIVYRGERTVVPIHAVTAVGRRS
jgi:hypothetical protein